MNQTSPSHKSKRAFSLVELLACQPTCVLKLLRRRNPWSGQAKTGFSLVELLVVMAIIGILMGLVIGIAGAVNRGTAETAAKAQIADLMNEIEKYRAEEGAYPDNWTSFGTWYNTRYSGTAYTITDGTSIAPLDPWGTPYFYTNGPTPFVYHIGSYGPNTTDDNGNVDDITNRNGAL